MLLDSNSLLTLLNYLQFQSLNIIPLAGLALIISHYFSRKHPQLVHGLWMLVLLRMIIPTQFGLTGDVSFWIPSLNTVLIQVDPMGLNGYGLEDFSSALPHANSPFRFLPPVIAILWLCGVTLTLGRILILRGWLKHQPRKHNLTPHIQVELQHLKQHFGIKRKIIVCQTHRPNSNTYTMGSIIPRIILSDDVKAHPQSLRSMLAHECAHIARWDDLNIFVSQVIMSIFFFHPAVWVARKILMETREMAVDRMVLNRKLVSMRDYAHALIDNASQIPAPGLSAPFNAKKRFLKNRILAMKGKSKMKTRTVVFLMMITLPLLCVSWVTLPAPLLSAPTVPVRSSESQSFISPVGSARLTSGFGERKHPLSKKMAHHNGIDLAAKTGTPVKAAADGTVESAKFFKKSWGKRIVVRHRNGFTTFYAQLSEIKVEEGQKVKQGDIIGTVGSTGKSTGPHLHFEIRQNDEPLDPSGFITI